MKKQQGFTLIELMIVIAIIAILAAIALPAYQDYTIRSQVSEGAVLADGAKTSVAEFASNTGRWPGSNLSAGLASATSINGNYVSSVTVTAGLIAVAYGGPKANSAITSSSVLDLSPYTQGGTIKWTCKPGANISPKYLPTTCRS